MAVIISEVYVKEPTANDPPILVLGIGAGQYRDSEDNLVKNKWVFKMHNLFTGFVMEGYLNGAELKSLKAGQSCGTISGFNFDLKEGQPFRLNVGPQKSEEERKNDPHCKTYPCVVKKVLPNAPPLILTGKGESSTTTTPPPISGQRPDYAGKMEELWRNQQILNGVMRDL